MPHPRILLPEWLRDELDLGRVPGFKWIGPGEFQIPWIHGSSSRFDEATHALLYQRYATHTGKEPGNTKRAKANFRCALNSLIKRRILEKLPCHEKDMRRYRFQPDREKKPLRERKMNTKKFVTQKDQKVSEQPVDGDMEFYNEVYPSATSIPDSIPGVAPPPISSPSPTLIAGTFPGVLPAFISSPSPTSSCGSFPGGSPPPISLDDIAEVIGLKPQDEHYDHDYAKKLPVVIAPTSLQRVPQNEDEPSILNQDQGLEFYFSMDELEDQLSDHSDSGGDISDGISFDMEDFCFNVLSFANI